MSVVAVTLLVSLSLTGIFIVAFLAEHLRSRDGGPDHDSLLPLDEPAPPGDTSLSDHQQ